VGGHQRAAVLRREGVLETEVVVVHLDEEEEQALNLTLNNPAVSGDFSTDLGALLADLQAAFEPVEFAALALDDLMSFAPALDLDEPRAPKPAPSSAASDIDPSSTEAVSTTMVALTFTPEQAVSYRKLVKAARKTLGTATDADTILAALRAV